AVDRKALEDDQLGLVRLRIQDLAGRVAQHRHQIVVQALASGGSATCYDGTAFFGSSHPILGGTATNKTSAALSNSSLSDAMSAMMVYAD
ncbi:Mu-like prophage major head subunit gpT family protein, partial [Escherichia coli]